MQLFSADSTIFLKDFKNSFAPENMKNPISKDGHDWPIFFFFSVLPTGPKPGQILISVPQKLLTA
jgi:hypothetical protein